MARRRSRAKKPSSKATSFESSTPSTARQLRTLPSATSTRRLARTPSKITELIDHAHHHVDLAMRLCDGDRTNDEAWSTHEPIGRLGDTSTVTKKATVLLRVLLRKKQRVVRFAGKPPLEDARYNRLKQGYESVMQHLKDTDETRKGLEDAFITFRKYATALESVLPPEPRDSRIMTTSLHACFAYSTHVVDEMLTILSQDVAAQTQAKAKQLAAFKDELDKRERLLVETTIAKDQLNQFLKLKLKHRSTIPGAYDLELTQRKHEYSVLRRRLVSMTGAMEHVFQFHSHLDQCIVDPEMTLIHENLMRFFEKHARVFEKNLK